MATNVRDSAAPAPFSFVLHRTDAQSAARRSTFFTPHGPVEMPAFMPVGTQGTVKGLTIEQVRASGAHMILGNTYHLALRPGENVIAELGGLHAFFGWTGAILTDSGGFQLHSLAQNTRVTEAAATFRSHIDGKLLELTPERAVAIQESLGSDVAMVLDHVVSLPAKETTVRDACERTVRWAERCQKASRKSDQALFAIVQGGLNVPLRQWCAEELVKLNFPGYAIGGLSVGEKPDDMYRIIEATTPALPENKPRYLMGVGRPQDLLEGIRRGIDMFDCVMPTRNGRNATAFTDAGQVKLRNLQYERERSPLEANCPCAACRHSRGYLRHLFMANEMLGPILVTIHNTLYYQRVMAAAREAIEQDRFLSFYVDKMRNWQTAESAL